MTAPAARLAEIRIMRFLRSILNENFGVVAIKEFQNRWNYEEL